MVKTSELQPTFLVALSSFASSSSGSLPLLLLLYSLLISLLLNGAAPLTISYFATHPPALTSSTLSTLRALSSSRALSSTDLSSCAIPSAAPSSSALSTSPYISLLRLALRHPPPWRCHHHNQCHRHLSSERACWEELQGHANIGTKRPTPTRSRWGEDAQALDDDINPSRFILCIATRRP